MVLLIILYVIHLLFLSENKYKSTEDEDRGKNLVSRCMIKVNSYQRTNDGQIEIQINTEV